MRDKYFNLLVNVHHNFGELSVQYIFVMYIDENIIWFSNQKHIYFILFKRIFAMNFIRNLGLNLLFHH